MNTMLSVKLSQDVAIVGKRHRLRANIRRELANLIFELQFFLRGFVMPLRGTVPVVPGGY